MKGLVRIRLVRKGRTRQPVYNITVGKKRASLQSVPIEVIGTYNPVPTKISPLMKQQGVIPVKDVKLDFDRAKYWISVGAQPSDTIANLFKKAGLLHDQWPSPIKAAKIPPKVEVSTQGKEFA
ncbi:37S ribosomal protein S16, mitochondrial [Pichia californica]|uniref:37S ribosomal protein S16, mitochondrial n=1 Tax=Pichia californica TaxID=460514 RepID=A0A9P6WJ27_9ASCO|nr:37S ribosomal protein S16, mitochondrial [[Candida] californica]KAG0686983.1 37S ribosomal protein S16, mitochondrial [[Candida] californica]